MNVWIVKIKDTGFIEDDIKIFNSYSLANYYIKQHNKENEWFIRELNLIDNTYFLNKEEVFAVELSYNEYRKTIYKWEVKVKKFFEDNFKEVASFRNEINARNFIEKNYKYEYFCRG